jgi:RNA polymerase sigma factor (sigma-70 family)
MATRPLRALIQHLGRTAAPPGEGGLADAQLLDRWVEARDEAAFELLLWRHGPMVLHTCRRLLPDAHAAEDAFQATFLLLVQNAASIRKRQTLPAWLHRVAYRVALRARAVAARRARREWPAGDVPAHPGTDEMALGDLRAVLDEEIERLPEHYRRAFVLCCLEGKTQAETARLLGRPQGTVSSWLARARQRLRSRLERRGLAPGTELVPSGEETAPAALPAPLVDATIRVAAAGGGTADPASPAVASLVKGVMRSMLLGKLKVAALPLMLAAAVVGGTVFLRFAVFASPPTSAETAAGGAYRRDAGPDETPKGDLARLQGRWKLVKLEPAKFQEKQDILWDIKDHTVRVLLKGEEKLSCDFTLDEKADPKRIDISIPQDSGTIKTALGIYKLEGDTLTICQSRPERDAPKEFKAAADGPFPSLAVYQR